MSIGNVVDIWLCEHQGEADVVAVDRVDHQECPRYQPGSMAREEASSERGGGIPDIQILEATAFEDVLSSE